MRECSAVIDLFESASGGHLARLQGEVSESLGQFGFDAASRRLALAVGRPDGTGLVRWWDLADPRREPHVWLHERGAGWFARCPLLGHHPRPLHHPSRPLERLASQRTRDRAAGAAQRPRVLRGRMLRRGDCAGQSHPGLADGLGRRGGPLRHGRVDHPVSPEPERIMPGRDGGLRSRHRVRASRRRRVLCPAAKRSVRYHFLSFSSDETLLAIYLDTIPGGPQPPKVWDVATGRRLWTFPGRQDLGELAFIPASRSLIVRGASRLRICRLDPPKEPEALAGHASEAWAAAFAPDGKTLATASDDTHECRTIKLWDAANGQARTVLRDVGNVNAVAFAPDCRRVASTNEGGEIKLWDLGTGDLVQIIRSEADQLRCLAFSPDGREVVAAGKGKVIRDWDVVTGQELLTLEGHSAQINGLAFSPDGSILASAAHDGSVRLCAPGRGGPGIAAGNNRPTRAARRPTPPGR